VSALLALGPNFVHTRSGLRFGQDGHDDARRPTDAGGGGGVRRGGRAPVDGSIVGTPSVVVAAQRDALEERSCDWDE
jgi:hypothetical protein